tara:strand:+ start:3092 stop:3262 length:171 start_codon:yes stop_codon:yes gene_type:complete
MSLFGWIIFVLGSIISIYSIIRLVGEFDKPPINHQYLGLLIFAGTLIISGSIFIVN